MRKSLKLKMATRKDVPVVLELIKELAAYERLSGDVTATVPGLRRSLFGKKPLAKVLLAYAEGRAVGLAVYFFQFSTFKAAPVLYLEDLFVQPDARGRGIGRRCCNRPRHPR